MDNIQNHVSYRLSLAKPISRLTTDDMYIHAVIKRQQREYGQKLSASRNAQI